MALLQALSGCATYNPRPLPDAGKIATAGEPDLEQLKVRAASFKHPLLKPMKIDLADGLSPDEASILAVLANPELAVVRDAHGETAAQLIGAGILPNPEFSAELDNPYGPGSSGTVDAYNLGLSMGLSPLLGRAAGVAAASSELEAVDLGIAWREWEVAQAARLVAIRFAMLGRRLVLLEDQIKTERETVTMLAGAVADGDVTIEDLGVHRASLESLKQQKGDLDREAASVRSRLNRLLGLPPATRIDVFLPDNQTFPALPPASGLVTLAVGRRLDLAALEIGYSAQEARVREAVSAQFPSLSIGVISQRNESALKFLGGFVTLGLPLFDRNQGGIASARATRTRLQHEFEARIAMVRANVSRIAVEDSLFAEQVRETRRGIESLAGIESAEQSAVESGDVGRLAWQQVRMQLLDLRLQQLVLHQARMELRVALATAIGGEVPGQ